MGASGEVADVTGSLSCDACGTFGLPYAVIAHAFISCGTGTSIPADDTISFSVKLSSK